MFWPLLFQLSFDFSPILVYFWPVGPFVGSYFKGLFTFPVSKCILACIFKCGWVKCRPKVSNAVCVGCLLRHWSAPVGWPSIGILGPLFSRFLTGFGQIFFDFYRVAPAVPSRTIQTGNSYDWIPRPQVMNRHDDHPALLLT